MGKRTPKNSLRLSADSTKRWRVHAPRRQKVPLGYPSCSLDLVTHFALFLPPPIPFPHHVPATPVPALVGASSSPVGLCARLAWGLELGTLFPHLWVTKIPPVEPKRLCLAPTPVVLYVEGHIGPKRLSPFFWSPDAAARSRPPLAFCA